MGFLDKLKFDLWDRSTAVTDLINRWKPRGCKTEKDFELSLYDFLHKELGETQITKQFARGRIRADLVVAEKVIVELKTNLDSTGKFQRLIGQLAAYEEWDGSVIVLLTGTTDQNLLKELKLHTDKLNSKRIGPIIGGGSKFQIVEK